MDDIFKMYFETMFKQYKTLRLNKSQMSEVCNLSTSTLDRHREKGLGCEYSMDKGKVFYPIDKVVSYLSKTNKTV
jgi:hypothetical protein